MKSIELAERGDIDGRRALAENDLKRFWRVKPDSEGRVLVAYVDPLLLKVDIQSPAQKSLVPCLVIDLS
ncbi:MAG: hypothetical protein QXX87_01675 [Candidatus Jordarchaeales archaeon]